ncbi:hypothetical protein QBC41DRAFT_1349 [Cercophora samala]|uniref:Uncharacterized protein n=1 Tax=Cercophora samala TaxID=330535 RepID=A0AA40DI54_9PEZI|nr:hypothetical protein QBC41DRAFT_1349 [Cercophora samala]
MVTCTYCFGMAMMVVALMAAGSMNKWLFNFAHVHRPCVIVGKDFLALLVVEQPKQPHPANNTSRYPPCIANCARATYWSRYTNSFSLHAIEYTTIGAGGFLLANTPPTTTESHRTILSPFPNRQPSEIGGLDQRTQRKSCLLRGRFRDFIMTRPKGSTFGSRTARRRCCLMGRLLGGVKGR